MSSMHAVKHSACNASLQVSLGPASVRSLVLALTFLRLPRVVDVQVGGSHLCPPCMLHCPAPGTRCPRTGRLRRRSTLWQDTLHPPEPTRASVLPSHCAGRLLLC